MPSNPVNPPDLSHDSEGDSKLPLLVIEALGSLACGFYGNYVFFLFRDRFGFGDLGNLTIASLMGLVVAIAAWQGGRFAQRSGCYRTMAIGVAGMVVALACGGVLSGLPAQLAVLIVWTASQFVVWPALESLVTEGVQGAARSNIVGIYSMVWAACSALSYFFGGSLFDRFGSESIFWLPIGLHLVQLAILWRMARRSREFPPPPSIDLPVAVVPVSSAGRPSPRTFQRMAWVANPFACVAAFTLLAMIPDQARQMGLSVTMAGWFGSIWFFGRLVAFVVLWRWAGWHYRFRWLLAGYILLMVGFATVLTSNGLWWFAAGQAAFGLAVGMLYYASLFYSMDVGEARAEQGGIHEAMMGAGNFVGPGIGALSMIIAPNFPHSGVWTVSALLAGGFAMLVTIRVRGGRTRTPCKSPS